MLLKPSRIGSYKDIVWLVVKYGNADMVKQSGLCSQLRDLEAVDGDAGKPEEIG